ncbi:MAG: hypothetical protein U5R31_07365 [Acidimicrobiia bacterium]|nr:hypothetical protein [Acidimicrobiia bacterium]
MKELPGHGRCCGPLGGDTLAVTVWEATKDTPLRHRGPPGVADRRRRAAAGDPPGAACSAPAAGPRPPSGSDHGSGGRGFGFLRAR